MNYEQLQRGAVICCIVLTCFLFLASLGFAIAGPLVSAGEFSLLKEIFEASVQAVLLPMYTTLVTATLAYVFGKEIVLALAARIRGGR